MSAVTRENVQSDYRYGRFSEDGMSFFVTNPATPRAFDSFLWNDSVMSCVHQTGVGTCDVQIDESEAIQVFAGVGRVCDVEVYGRDHLMSRLVYVRDNETGEFWNVGWEPVCREYDFYECEHGLGYTRITSETCGIRSSLLLFVPLGNDPVEVWELTHENVSGRSRDLSVFVYNQYSLTYMWGFESYGDMLYRGAWFEPSCNAMIVQKHPYIAPHGHLTAFLTADRPVDGHDGSRRHFVGDYSTLSAPEAVVNGACTNTPGSCEATIAALQFDISLGSGETEVTGLINGLADGLEQVENLASRYLSSIGETFEELRRTKRAMVEKNAVATPDPHFDRIVNVWLKQQSAFGAKWCRWGYMGYRDIVQHGMGVSSFAPDRTREILVAAIAHMNSSGVALRGWNPVDTKPYSDSTLWLVYTLTAYLKETGDIDFLHARVPYYDGGDGTVLEHIERALDFLERNKGSHGLCLIKFGDWNDSLTNIGKEGRGESVWLSMAYIHALNEMSGLYEFIEDGDKALYVQGRAESMRRAVRASSWDGKWFVRCFDDRGHPVGSHANEEGSIYLNTQSWAIIAGVDDPEQRRSMLDACRQNLMTKVGYRLLAPPYLTRDDHIGRISYLEPGICENGTIYSHGNAFMFLAQLMAGMGEEAYETFTCLTPGYMSSSDCPKQKCPPYVYANGHYAPEHRNNAMQVEFTWVTGSVAWWYNSVLEYMLGFRRDYDGITIDPCLPSAWPKASLQRNFRGKSFDVDIRRTGEFSLMLNGCAVEGRYLPLSSCSDENLVEVTV